ncbi:GNAT family N-acetyltransferase [Chitinolyticbacter albus]|uniref:GNAT family N-acetyltransferase n=1 Tax=Chitinolyticbacter albus TaxID=2961951 RepID=UPI002108D8FC|nr:GNAT family N-acetyltransferase [Chitinolyticbacter albus]
MTKPTLSYKAKGVRLRPLRDDDLEFTLAWRNREGVRQCFIYSDLITLPQHLRWFEQYTLKSDDCVLIAETANGERIGQLAIYDIDVQKKTAEIGRFVVAPEFAGQGLMRSAIEALCVLAKESLELNELYLEVLPTNASALGLYLRLGFQAGASDADKIKMTKSLI